MSVIVMNNLRQLLVAIAALTLLFSAVSGANPNYFAGYTAFADQEDDGEDNNTGSSSEERDDSDSDEHDDGQSVEATFGTSSHVQLGIDNEIDDSGDNAGLVEADLAIEAVSGDLSDGEHAVSFSCGTPDFDKAFDSSLVVENGNGSFQASLGLVNGTTYQDCHVNIGDMVVSLPEFTPMAGASEDDGANDADHGRSGAQRQNNEGDDSEENDNGRGHERSSQVENEDHGIKIDLETNTTLADGTYNVHFTCENPAVDMTFTDAFIVEGGQGEFKADIDLAAGNYEMCKVLVGDEVLATYDAIVVGAEDDDVQEKRNEKRRELVANTNAEEEHKRRLNAHPASTGDYDPGWNYTLIANGTGSPRVDDEDELSSLNATAPTNSTLETTAVSNVDVNIDLGVWKSNKALILLSVLNGTIEVDGQTYNVELGYALYSVTHNVMRIGAFVSDEDGNIYKLMLRGNATGEDAAFPMTSGESVDMVFEGNSGPARNAFSHWYLDLEGTVKAD